MSRDLSIDNDILLRCLSREMVERPPIWIMRQAGRILPEYRALRSNFPNFKAFIKKPKAVCEATIQPIDALGVDAAILFSDILVIPEAMGLDYDLVEKKGPVFRKTITNPSDVENLVAGMEAASKIDYVYAAIEETLDGLKGRVPLIGFSGAPWTLFAYMVEGQGSKTFSQAKKFLYQYPEASKKALDMIAETVIAYLKLKIKHGVHVVQLFDSWTGVLNQELYEQFCLPYIQKIRSAISEVPLIYFPKDGWYAYEMIQKLGFDVIGLDWSVPMTKARNIFGSNQILQGNMDPCALYAEKGTIERMTLNTIDAMGRNHIFNLGHGVYPDIDRYHVKYMVDVIKAYRYPSA